MLLFRGHNHSHLRHWRARILGSRERGSPFQVQDRLIAISEPLHHQLTRPRNVLLGVSPGVLRNWTNPPSQHLATASHTTPNKHTHTNTTQLEHTIVTTQNVAPTSPKLFCITIKGLTRDVHFSHQQLSCTFLRQRQATRPGSIEPFQQHIQHYIETVDWV